MVYQTLEGAKELKRVYGLGTVGCMSMTLLFTFLEVLYLSVIIRVRLPDQQEGGVPGRLAGN